eukprot:GSMAST32.ASY1.ANO1.1877.1 assembled CDS
MDKSISTLASGGTHTTFHNTSFGWNVKVCKAPILINDKTNVSSEYSQNSWCRDLNLTLHAEQHLPEATFGGNILELRHLSSGVHIRFCAIEALRCWALQGLDPVAHLSKNVKQCEWDYTFTTAYPGSTSMEQVNASQVPGRSIYSRTAVDLARGPPILRKPLCKCVSGGVPLVKFRNDSDASKSTVSLSDISPSVPPSPQWRPTHEKVDIRNLMKTQPHPQFREIIDLWRDNLDPQSLCFLRAKVFVCANFWALYLRCFARVNGVMARVIDTRFVCKASEPNIVLRERSWREGNWEKYAGKDAAAYLDFYGGDGDELAVQRLPLLRPPITEKLTIPSHTKTYIGSDYTAVGSNSYLWKRNLRCESISVFVVTAEGRGIEMLNAATGDTKWSRASPEGTTIVSAAVYPFASSTHECRLALGTECGKVYLVKTSSGEDILHFPVVPEKSTKQNSRTKTAMNSWVDNIAWSSNGESIVAAAGRIVVAYNIQNRVVVGKNIIVNEVNGFNSIELIPVTLEIGATAVLSISVSSDGRYLAAGCLDNRVRIFEIESTEKDTFVKCKTSSTRDWVGITGPVTSLSWSCKSRWLAACGGDTLLVIPGDLPSGEPPIVCIPPRQKTSSCGEVQKRFKAISWAPSVQVESLLAAVESNNGRAYIFNVLYRDDGVPRVANPIYAIECPENSIYSGTTSSLQNLAFSSMFSIDHPTLIISHGDVIASTCVPSKILETANECEQSERKHETL